MDLQAIIKRRAQIMSHDAMVRQNFADHQQRVKAELASLAEREAFIVGGLDTAKIDAGLAILTIQGQAGNVVNGWYPDQDRRGVRHKVVQDAKSDIADGAPKLRSQYFGVKNYDAFGDQREDHTYGSGPRHGSIVFRVGLHRDVVQRLRDGGELTPEEIDAALYVLAALPQIEDARAKVAA